MLVIFRNCLSGTGTDWLKNTTAIRCAVLLGLWSLAGLGGAAVLPEERADLLYHKYDGGGVEVDGPSLLVRKNIGDSVSVGLNHYVDNVTSASIDVVVSASEYTEEREENNISIDYLRQKTTVSMGYTVSDESDFEAKTLSLGISQDMFGDLTTVSMSFAFGDNTVGQNQDESCEREARPDAPEPGLTWPLPPGAPPCGQPAPHRLLPLRAPD